MPNIQQMAFPDIKAALELGSKTHTKASGAKTGSVGDYLTDQIPPVKVVKDLLDPNVTEKEKLNIAGRWFTGVEIREITAKQKAFYAKKNATEAKKKMRKALGVG